MKILIVEDEPSMRELIKESLEKERFVVETAGDISTAVQKAGTYNYDCILLDVMLPDGSGLKFLEQLKRMRKRENVIIISAKDSLEDKVLGLDLGADDYLPKPFHLAELNARVKSLLRRRHRDGEHAVTVGNVTLFPDNFRVEVDGNPLELSRKEYDILHHFMNRPGRMVSKGALAESVWGDHIDQADNFDFIYAQMKNLRKKLSEAGASIEVKAVYGLGYKLVE
ncbi:MAG: response regulator transcription factor [Bacteroidales bacterium]|nr:response regulator transcription factor [Bacteroidales bacterium]